MSSSAIEDNAKIYHTSLQNWEIILRAEWVRSAERFVLKRKKANGFNH